MTRFHTMWITGVAVAAVLAGDGAAFAHQRDYVLNEPYYTTRKGEWELEVLTDYNQTDFDNDNTHSFKQQYEIEYGLTSRLQVAYYEIVKWTRTNDWQRDALKVETKYRFAEAGEWPVDVALYGEYEGPNGRQDTDSDTLEGKLIVSKDLGPWNVVTNLIVERKINQHDFWGVAYTAGVSYPITQRVRAGLELKETLGDLEGEFGIRRKKHQVQLMPALYASLTPHVRLLVGPVIGVTKAADDFQIRSIVEIEF